MLLIFVFIINISIQPEYYTNNNYIYELVGKDSIVYCATNGGVAAYNYLNDMFKVLTSSDGLQLNRQTCLGVDSSGFIWVGSDLGLAVINQDFNNIQLYPVQELPSLIIQEICCIKDTIYIGSTGGLLIIDTKGTSQDFTDDVVEIKRQTDGLPSNNVISIAVDDTSLWVGTYEGLVHFNKDFISPPTVYTTDNGLLSNYINKVAIIDTSVYVGTELGLNRFQGDYFDTLLNCEICEIKDIVSAGDSLVLALNPDSQVGIYYQSALTIVKNGLPNMCPVLSLANVEGNLFCGLANRYSKDYYGEGIGVYDFNAQVWNIIKNQCLPSNHIVDITANDFGVFVCCGARSSESRGFGWLNNNGVWVNFNRDSILPSNHIHRCATAPDKKVWFGLNYIGNSGKDTVVAFSYEPANDEWRFLGVGYNDMESTDAVWDLEFDYNNNMYINIGNPSDKVWVIDSALNTVYALDPYQPGFFTEIAVDSTGKVWRTFVSAGLFMIDTKNTLFDRSDDNFYNYTTSDGLLSNYTSGCIVGREGNLYVTTADGGLIIYDGTVFSSITDISNEDLFDIELDSEGRIWILARDGIYYYDPKFNVTDGWRFIDLTVQMEFLEFTTEIIQVQGFEFDPIRGCFWVGGETGLLKLKVQYDTIPALDNIVVYPNPVFGRNIVRIKNIPLDARLNIYSITGRLVAEDLLPDDVFGEVVWEIPEDIGSGLYFVLVKSNQGNKVCKFAIVR